MIYQLPDGGSIDTARDLSFDERNFLQKMMIFEHLGEELSSFQARWRQAGNSVWTGPDCLNSPKPVVRILLDMERRIKQRGAANRRQ